MAEMLRLGVDWSARYEMRRGITTIKVRYYEGDRIVARYDHDRVGTSGVRPPPDDSSIPDAIVITDYGKGDVSPPSAKSWCACARDRNVPVYVDPKLGRAVMWREIPGINRSSGPGPAPRAGADP